MKSRLPKAVSLIGPPHVAPTLKGPTASGARRRGRVAAGDLAEKNHARQRKKKKKKKKKKESNTKGSKQKPKKKQVRLFSAMREDVDPPKGGKRKSRLGLPVWPDDQKLAAGQRSGGAKTIQSSGGVK